MADANDIYGAIVGTDTGEQLRVVLAEIAQGVTLLTQDEQGFVQGFEANLDLGMPVTAANVKTLLQIRDIMRARAHAATGVRGR